MATISIPTGSVTLFRQPTAPVRWTKNTTYDNYALRLTSGTVGTGGNASVSFSTLNSISAPWGTTFNITSVSVGSAASSITPHSHGTTVVTYPSPTVSPIQAPKEAFPQTWPTPSTLQHYSSGLDGDTRATSGGTSALVKILPNEVAGATAVTGGAGTHSHTITPTSQAWLPAPGFAGGTFTFKLKYLDVILCTRTG